MKTFFSFKEVFTPKLFSSLRTYNKQRLLQDAIAGMIVGIVAIPLAIAFGISSGVGPTEGLVTAIIAGFIISAFGGSKVQIGGPTGAFIVIIYGNVQCKTVDNRNCYDHEEICHLPDRHRLRSVTDHSEDSEETESESDLKLDVFHHEKEDEHGRREHQECEIVISAT